MEFEYSVGNEKRGEAQSVNFHDLGAESGDDLDQTLMMARLEKDMSTEIAKSIGVQ
jgi:hypothetical protein